jgi:hypothetical protein
MIETVFCAWLALATFPALNGIMLGNARNNETLREINDARLWLGRVKAGIRDGYPVDLPPTWSRQPIKTPSGETLYRYDFHIRGARLYWLAGAK